MSGPRRMRANPSVPLGSVHAAEHDEITPEDSDDMEHWCAREVVRYGEWPTGIACEVLR